MSDHDEHAGLRAVARDVLQDALRLSVVLAKMDPAEAEEVLRAWKEQQEAE